jgi:hypothetical protein
LAQYGVLWWPDANVVVEFRVPYNEKIFFTKRPSIILTIKPTRCTNFSNLFLE